LEFKFNQQTGRFEIIINEYDISYQTANEQVYDMEVYDSEMLEGVKIMCSNEEFIRVLNNPRLAFLL